MTVRLGDVTFSDWISLQYEGEYTDTFIFHIDALNGLPPFGYRPLLQRLVAELNQKRPGASLWIRVESPGEWYVMEVKRSMIRGFSIPYVVTRLGEEPDYRKFSFRPRLYSSSLHRAPTVEETQDVSPDELRCLQVLGRIVKGNEQDVASLAGLSEGVVMELLPSLEKKGLVIHKVGNKIIRDKSKQKKLDSVPLWHLKRKGLKLALRSWGVPKGIEFTSRTEENLQLIDTDHRHISRSWPAWLKTAWPRAEIWTGWSEVGLPETSVLPDALAWGRIQGYETLFWLEVGDEHKKRVEIEKITRKRLNEAWKFCQETGVRLVYAQLSVDWVHDAARWAFGQLPSGVAVVMGHQRKAGQLPMVEWGTISFQKRK